MSNGIKDLDELWGEMLANEEQLGKQVYVQDGNIVIKVAYEYAIELPRCDTHEKILAWVVQLSEKTWITAEVIRRFVYLAVQQNGLELSQP